ncbi:hypothetical protein M8C21_020046 [Ambrosia artemisiifolia]|uniref:PGG domain-containing protein n=1 Tax=Ambrosia artemisiifolia TaxID=4212 RepID=A0AAD5CWB8_AMBAR|nr:hypothetical protein M8C21_020046 [Ambrosia artemisiifolia]
MFANSNSTLAGFRRPEPVVSASTQDLKYTQALNVNVSNYVTVKLSGSERNNYTIWKGQMLCLIESQDLLHVIDEEYFYGLAKYDNLVKSWILSTMNEQLLNDYPDLFDNSYSATDLWGRVKLNFGPAEPDSNNEDEPATSPGFEFRRTELARVPEIEDADSIKIKNELYEAAVEGWWWKAKSILKIHKNAATEVITTTGDTILHIAVERGHNYFLEKLLDFLKGGEDIEKKNDKGRTALHIAAAVGNTHAAQLLVQKRSHLLQILDCNKKSPLVIGYTNRKFNTYAYLVKSAITSDIDTDSIDEVAAIMTAIITKDYVHPIKNIEKKKKEYKEAKKILSLVCSQMGTRISYYKYSLFEAVRQDNYEVVDEILLTSPATIDCKDEEGYNIIQLAIMNRAEKVYSLLYHIIERTQSYREMEDSYDNNLVHLAGKLAPSFVLQRTTGAALQLQREILWREEVTKLRLPIDLGDVNKNKETPAMVFTREHRDLMKEGENWIKTTAESCSITAALIVTVVFAAAITVPGGSNQDSGIPVFKNEAAFTVFAFTKKVDYWSCDVIPLHNCYDGSLWCNLVPCLL